MLYQFHHKNTNKRKQLYIPFLLLSKTVHPLSLVKSKEGGHTWASLQAQKRGRKRGEEKRRENNPHKKNQAVILLDEFTTNQTKCSWEAKHILSKCEIYDLMCEKIRNILWCSLFVCLFGWWCEISGCCLKGHFPVDDWRNRSIEWVCAYLLCSFFCGFWSKKCVLVADWDCLAICISCICF